MTVRPFRRTSVVRAGWLLGLCLAALFGARAAAQAPATPAPQPATEPAAAPEELATLWYANRPIVDLHGSLMSRTPAQRASAAAHLIDELMARGVTGPVTTRKMENAVALVVGQETVLALLPADADVLAGETLDLKAAVAAIRLQAAIAEAVELRTPGRLVWAVGTSAAATALLLFLLWLLLRLERYSGRRLTAAAERQLARVEHTLGGQVMRVASVSRAVYAMVRGALAVTAAILIYLWLSFVLRRFPYTRPLGESLRTILLERLELLGSAVLSTFPNLFTVAVILIVARILSKIIALVFAAVERGSLMLPGVYPDTAVATRRLVTALLWLFTLAVAYPYVPGSNTSGFQGISVFVGVIISLGSTGVVQHLMSGLMLTFARAVRVGDFARVGEVEGTVTQIGALATKIRTARGEEVTIPNAVVVGQTMTNYSKLANDRVPLLTTSVTIGYDTPWRQVEELLLEAAARTPGVCRNPPPVVWRVGLEDYYIKHTLMLTPERPTDRPAVLDQLHSHILDAFNEVGVQIMSPHYMADPALPKVVPRSRPPLAAPGVADASVGR